MTKGNYSKQKTEKGVGMPLGAYILDKKRIQFSISVQNVKSLNLHLFPGNDDNAEIIVNVDQRYRIGSIFSIIVTVPDSSQCGYIYEVNELYFCDPYARQLTGRENWGEFHDDTMADSKVRCKAVSVMDIPVGRKYPREIYKLSDLFIYRLHVRGFTKDSSSGVKAKGTFRGIEEKIPYLKDLGVNAVELMPCYEFDEILFEQGINPYGFSSSITMPVYHPLEEEGKWKVNYWGYTEKSNYFAPKTSYCQDKENPCREVKEMIQKLHESDIEVYMEFYFAYNTNQNLIVDCLRFWHQEYDVDGFKLNKEWIPEKLLATDPLLGQVKLFTSDWSLSYLYPDEKYPEDKFLADDNESFMISARRYLKGDEEQVQGFAENLKANPCHKGKINYLANTNSMTLMDMVSYDVKHNELNGESGRDGTDYNYSWNCGWEGKTRRKAVMELRKRQIKNALIMLFFSQGTPLMLAGDEIGNSQDGNNNPYCVDGPISWVNWNQKKKNVWLTDFVKKLAAFRKEHKILHMDEQLKTMDYISCGCPDLSFHGTQAWYPDYSNYSRELGVLLCGKYAKVGRGQFDRDIYIAFNFHWEPHEFSLPNTLKGKPWHVLIDTSSEEDTDFTNEGKLVTEKTYTIKPRTVVVFLEADTLEKNKPKKGYM